MKYGLTYISPVLGSRQSDLRIDLLDKSKDLHEAGQYVDALKMFMSGLGPDLASRYSSEDGRRFVVPHGSIVVTIDFTGDTFDVSADFLRIPEESRVAMLRQVLYINVRQLMLARFVTEGDVLRIKYSCPIDQTHPYKIYPLLGNICSIGDMYDDEFCTKFGAERIYTPQITPYTPSEVARIYADIQRVGRETLGIVREFVNDRMYSAAWYLISTSFMHIMYLASPKGQLEADLDKAIERLDEELPVTERVARACNDLEEILSRTEDQIAQGLYHTETLISPKSRSSLHDIQEHLENAYEDASKAIQSGDSDRVVVRLLHAIYNAYRLWDIQDDLNRLFARILSQASGKPIDEAARILYIPIDRLMEGEDIDEIETVESGSGLWGWFRSLLAKLFN